MKKSYKYMPITYLSSQSHVITNAPIAKEATTPVFTVCDDMLFHQRRFPAELASYIPTPVIVPQFPVGVANVTVPLLLVWSGAEGAPDNAAHPEEAIATLAYELPLTSTAPVPASSDGFVVYSATYVFANVAGNVVPFNQFKRAFSKY